MDGHDAFNIYKLGSPKVREQSVWLTTEDKNGNIKRLKPTEKSTTYKGKSLILRRPKYQISNVPNAKGKTVLGVQATANKKLPRKEAEKVHDNYFKKSYVPGQGYQSIASMSSKQRSALKAAKGAGPKKGPTAEDKKFKSDHQSLSHYLKGSKPVTTTPLAPGKAGETFRTGSAKDGKSYVRIQPGLTKEMKQAAHVHEGHHAGPKRSTYRLHRQIMEDPFKLAREEARADFHGSGHYSKTPKAIRSGYGQMARLSDKLDKPLGKLNPINRMQHSAQKKAFERQSNHYSGVAGNRSAWGEYAAVHNKMKKAGVKPENNKQIKQLRAKEKRDNRIKYGTAAGVATAGAGAAAYTTYKDRKVSKSLKPEHLKTLRAVGVKEGDATKKGVWANSRLEAYYKGTHNGAARRGIAGGTPRPAVKKKRDRARNSLNDPFQFRLF